MTSRTMTGGFCLKLFGCLATGVQKWRENKNLTNFRVSSVVVYFLSRYVLKAESWVPRPSFYPLSIGSLRFLRKYIPDPMQGSQREVTCFFALYFFSFYFFSWIRWQKPLQFLFQLIEFITGYRFVFFIFFYPWLWVR